MCFFGEATQKSNNNNARTSLGHFKGWGADGAEPGTDEYYQRQLYADGQRCWNGPQRSAKVGFQLVERQKADTDLICCRLTSHAGRPTPFSPLSSRRNASTCSRSRLRQFATRQRRRRPRHDQRTNYRCRSIVWDLAMHTQVVPSCPRALRFTSLDPKDRVGTRYWRSRQRSSSIVLYLPPPLRLPAETPCCDP